MPTSHLLKWLVGFFFAYFKCDFRVRETPSTIPNLEVKTYIADNTVDFIYGNVGHCTKRTVF